MAILTVRPETVHRDWDDVKKFAGHPFEEYTYEAPTQDDPYGVIHRVEWAIPVATGPLGSPLDPVDRYIAVKNYSRTDTVLLYFDTVTNQGDPLEIAILPGHWVEVVDLDVTTQPRIRTDPTLTSNSVECEILEVGYTIFEEEEPEIKCDMWAVGHIPAAGCGSKHYPEAGAWANVLNGLEATADHWLADVAGVDVTDYWAVGYETDQGTPSAGLLMHWTGAAWAEEVVESDPPLYGDWGFSTSDYWAVGGLLTGEIWHYNGIVWAQALDIGPDDRTFRCVHGWLPTDTYAAGDEGLIYWWNGAVWAPDPNQIETDHLYGVWSANPVDIWVVGGSAGLNPGQSWWGASGGTGAIYRKIGAVWTLQVIPPQTPCLRACWGFATNDTWAVGDQGTILHWDGFVWTAIPEPAELQGNYDYRGVFGCFPWSVWAIGTSQTGDNVIINWDGISWTVNHGPNADEMDLLGLKGVEIVIP